MRDKHLSLTVRHYIEIERKLSTSLNKFAAALNRSQSSLSRKLKRNTGQRGYRHHLADKLAENRHQTKPKQVKITEQFKLLIDGYLENDWSPEQMTGRMEKDKVIKLHHEPIYQYILKDKRADRELYKKLRHQGKTYRKRYGSPRNRTGTPNRVGIEQRLTVANNHGRLGNWDADTIIGKNHKGAIVTLDDRKTKLRL